MSDSIYPPKGRMCHRCNFDKTCRDLVTSEACGRWAQLGVELPDGKMDIKYMCQDDLELGVAVRTQKMVASLVESIEKLCEEGRQHHQAALQVNATVMQAALTSSKNVEKVAEALEALHCGLPALTPAEKPTPLLAAPVPRKDLS